MAIRTEDGFIPERYDCELDNRDQGTTWLRLEGCHGDYVEIDPIGVMDNMIENCYDEDVSFLFDRFQVYLNEVQSDVIEGYSIDHIVGFRNYLNHMIEQSSADKASGQPINPDTGEQT